MRCLPGEKDAPPDPFWRLPTCANGEMNKTDLRKNSGSRKRLADHWPRLEVWIYMFADELYYAGNLRMNLCLLGEKIDRVSSDRNVLEKLL